MYFNIVKNTRSFLILTAILWVLILSQKLSGRCIFMCRSGGTFFMGEIIMSYFDKPIKKVRTIEMLEISDIPEITVRDLERYSIPGPEIVEFLTKYVFPLENKAKELILKYNPQ